MDAHVFAVDVKREGVSLKKSLAERLGRVVDEEECPQKGEYNKISKVMLVIDVS